MKSGSVLVKSGDILVKSGSVLVKSGSVLVVGECLTYCRINWSDDTSIYYTVDAISIKIPFNQW